MGDWTIAQRHSSRPLGLQRRRGRGFDVNRQAIRRWITAHLQTWRPGVTPRLPRIWLS